MSSGNKRIKDKEVFLFNQITGELNVALKFNGSRIVTTDNNLLDRENLIYDEISGEYLPMGNLVVTDNDGNVILADEIADIPSRD
jgi:hypothetical protein